MGGEHRVKAAKPLEEDPLHRPGIGRGQGTGNQLDSHLLRLPSPVFYTYIFPSGYATVQVKNKSKKYAPNFGLDHIASGAGKIILRMLGEGKSQSEVAETTGFSKQKVNYWSTKFVSQGWITEEYKGKPKRYRLTALGQRILTGSERGGRRQDRSQTSPAPCWQPPNTA